MKWRIALILICLLALNGCVKKPAEESTENRQTSSREKRKYQKKIMKTVQKDGSYWVREYDSNGLIVKTVFYNADSTVRQTFVSTYDDDQNQVSEVSEKADGTKSYQKKEYDGNGNLIREYEGDSEDNLILRTDNVYEGGLLKQEIYYHQDGSLWKTYDYIYENGLLVKKTNTLPSGYLYRSWDYAYGPDGKLTKMTDTYHEHVSISIYDDRGQVLREEHYFKDEPSFTIVNTYGEYGITETLMTDADGSERRHNKTYYENGLIVRTTDVSEEGLEAETAYWEYDADGHLVHYVNHRGYEDTIVYNEFGDPVWEHDVCNDSLRNAGTYDNQIYYEYFY